MTIPTARITDPVQHILSPVLTGGPVSPNVLIGGLPAWLGVNPAAAIKAAKQAADIALQPAEQATLAAAPASTPATRRIHPSRTVPAWSSMAAAKC